MHHCEMVVAGADTGSARLNDLSAWSIAQDAPEFLRKNRCWLEAAVFAQVRSRGAIQRPRDVTRHRIHGLGFAAKAFT